jgi:hypothetical protein
MHRSSNIMNTTIRLAILSMVLLLAVGCAGTVAKHSTAKTASKAKTQAKKVSKQSDAKTTQTPQTPISVTGKTIRLTWQEEGKPSFDAHAKELVGDTLVGTASLKNVNADMYDKGQLVGKMTAPVVSADEKSRVVVATGGVTITLTSKVSSIRTLKAQRVKWYTRQDRIVGDGGVVAKGPTVSMKAEVFVSDSRLQKVRIFADPADAKMILGKQ